MTFRPAVFDRYIPAFDVAAFLKTIAERRDERCEIALRGVVNEPEDRRLLCARRERPRRCATEHAEKIATPHGVPQGGRPNLPYRRGAETGLCSSAQLAERWSGLGQQR